MSRHACTECSRKLTGAPLCLTLSHTLSFSRSVSVSFSVYRLLIEARSLAALFFLLARGSLPHTRVCCDTHKLTLTLTLTLNGVLSSDLRGRAQPCLCLCLCLSHAHTPRHLSLLDNHWLLLAFDINTALSPSVRPSPSPSLPSFASHPTHDTSSSRRHCSLDLDRFGRSHRECIKKRAAAHASRTQPSPQHRCRCSLLAELGHSGDHTLSTLPSHANRIATGLEL